MSIDYKIIGKRIKERRKICQITQETLAEKLGVSVGYISQIERGIAHAKFGYSRKYFARVKIVISPNFFPM